MDLESSDISLNIASFPIGAESTKRKKNRGKRRNGKADETRKSPSSGFVAEKEKNVEVPSFAPPPKETRSPLRHDERRPVSKKKPSNTVSFETDGEIPSAEPRLKRKFPTPFEAKPKAESGVELDKEYNYAKSSKTVSSSLFGNNPEVPAFPPRAVKPVSESVFSSELFKDLPVHDFMIANLRQNLGLTKLTTVQQKSIPVILSKRDVLIRSQTGSGKTLAYALPIVQALQEIRPKLPRSAGIQAIVVVPTRELALQTYELFVKLIKPFAWLVPGYLVGGEKRKSEKARLRKGITILIGTPGRILDHVNNTEVMVIDSVKWLVLDEADRLLDMGYEKDVSSLVSAIDGQAAKNPDIFKLDADNLPTVISRQTILVSATLTSGVERLAGLALKTPTRVDAAHDGAGTADQDGDLSIPESLQQYYVITPPKLRLVCLAGFIRAKCEAGKMLIFMATQDMVDFHTDLLATVFDDTDIDFFKLHGSMTQRDRTECFKTFRSSAAGVLLCTDVAARGLDLPHVDWIVQYTGPCSVADYVHRVGRTARVGVAGNSILFLATTEVEFVRSLEARKIRLQEKVMRECLERLPGATDGKRRDASAGVEAAATALQLKFEAAVMDQKTLHGQACKAFVSFVRFYASYPKAGRKIFSFKNLHLGHYAKCFALRDPPSSIGFSQKKQWRDDSTTRESKVRSNTSGPNKGRSIQAPKRSLASRSRDLITSEYSSGMPARKKRKATPS